MRWPTTRAYPIRLRDKFAHEPLLPKFALVAFDRMLGPAFILTGIMLLIGLGTRVSLLAQGLLFIALTVGLVLIDQNDGVAYLGIHIGLVAAAFLARPTQQICGAEKMVIHF